MAGRYGQYNSQREARADDEASYFGGGDRPPRFHIAAMFMIFMIVLAVRIHAPLFDLPDDRILKGAARFDLPRFRPAPPIHIGG
jgi:hypothetical protein